MYYPRQWKWFVLLGAFLSRVITTGTVICAGVFLPEIEETFPNSPSIISAVFSTASGLLEGTGIIASLMLKYVEARYLVFLGSLLAAFSVAAASFAVSPLQLLICFGILNGFGQGFARCLMPVAISFVFDDATRHVGISLQNVGDGLGGVIFPMLLEYLKELFLWRGAFLIVSAIVLHLLISAVVIPLPLKTCQKETGASVHSDSDEDDTESSGKEISWFPNAVLFYLNILCHSFGYYNFNTFIFSYMKGVGISAVTASMIFSAVGGVSIAGRLLVSFMDNKRVARWKIYALMHVIRGIAVMLFNLTPSTGIVPLYFVLCSIFGFTDGISGALIPLVCVDLMGLKRMAIYYGFQMFFMGGGGMLGILVIGALRSILQSFQIPLYISGSVFVMGGLVLVPLLWTRKYCDVQKQRAVELRKAA